MSKISITIPISDKHIPVVSNQRVFAIDTFLSMYESDCKDLSQNRDKVRFTIPMRGAFPQKSDSSGEYRGTQIAVAPIFKDDMNSVELFEMSMNALKKALCVEFNGLSDALRKELFPEAPVKELTLHMELYDNETIRNIEKEDLNKHINMK